MIIHFHSGKTPRDYIFEFSLWKCSKWYKIPSGYYYREHCVKSVHVRSFFWSVFTCIRTEYGDLLRKSLYSVRIQENTDHKKLHIWTLFTHWRRRLVGNPSKDGSTETQSRSRYLPEHGTYNFLVAFFTLSCIVLKNGQTCF